ncbi:MAG: hypothetical protein QOD67_3912 [Caballeronia sp.]|nr:hypothetical protein [Caballeronia sp.]
MAVNYGVLKGTVTGHLRNADDDHYQILVHAGTTVFRIASNVKSSAPHAPSTVLFEERDTLPEPLTSSLGALTPGFTKLPSTPGRLAIDYVRSGLVDTKAMTPVPADAPGSSNDLKDKLESAVVAAMAMEGSIIYAFGSRWGPEENKPDQYFKFVPGNGVHDIHMNQGNGAPYEQDNGVYQDGALMIAYADKTWRAFFFAFQSQTFDTDDHGNPIARG